MQRSMTYAVQSEQSYACTVLLQPGIVDGMCRWQNSFVTLATATIDQWTRRQAAKHLQDESIGALGW